MPYIKNEIRKKIDPLLDSTLGYFSLPVKPTPGDLNYVVSRLIHSFIQRNGLNYSTLNASIGVLECAKLELYRMILAPYEEDKRKENGPVSALDAENK